MTKSQRRHHREIKNLIAAGKETEAATYQTDHMIGTGLFHRAAEAGRKLRQGGTNVG